MDNDDYDDDNEENVGRSVCRNEKDELLYYLLFPQLHLPDAAAPSPPPPPPPPPPTTTVITTTTTINSSSTVSPYTERTTHIALQRWDDVVLPRKNITANCTRP
ncbi:hypothetical protein M0804_007218 [Polistes exclamans]|nr:hypothetical protein M0804_007218 [Polistes exclamans]